MKQKKALSKILVCLMAAFLLISVTGCGGGDSSGSADSTSSTVKENNPSKEAVDDSTGKNDDDGQEKEHVVLRMFNAEVETSRSSRDDDVGRKIYEDTGIEIEFIPFSESQYEKARMMLAAQDFEGLDFITTGMNDVTSLYIESNMLVNLDDYKDQLGNFYAYEEDVIPYWRTLDSENGNLYIWQSGPDQIQMTSTCLDMVTRVDALEACGWPDLDTTDDYVEFLKEAMEKIPESNGQKSIGMSCFWGDSLGPLITTYLPRHSGYQMFYETTGMVDVETGEIISLIDHPTAKETFAFYNTLYREGIMDAEIWTDGFAECQAKADSGVPITINFMNWAVTGANAKAIERGKEDMQYIVTPIRLASAKENNRTRYEAYTSMRPDNTTGILVTSENIEKAVELVNYMATAEMTLLTGWGEEGVDYTLDADGGIVCSDSFIQMMSSTEGSAYAIDKGFSGNYVNFPIRATATMPNGHAGRYTNDPAFTMAGATEVQLHAYENLGWENLTSPWRDNPNFKFEPFDITTYSIAGDLGNTSDIAKTEEKIAAYLDQQIPQLITADSESSFEKLYEEICATAESMGLPDVIKAYNEQLANADAVVEKYMQR